MGAQQGKERGSHSSGGGGGGHGGGTVSCIGVSSSSPVASGSPHCISGGSSSGGGGGGLSAGSTLRGSRMKSHQSAGHGSSGISIGSSGSSALSSHRGGSSSASHKDNRCNPTVGLNIFTEHNGKYASVCVRVCVSVYISHPQHTNALTVCIHPHTHTYRHAQA